MPLPTFHSGAQSGRLFTALTLFCLARTAAAQTAPLAAPPIAVPTVKPTAAKPTAVPTSKLFNAALLLSDLKTLSSDAMEGRGTGAPGGLKARSFIAEKFKAAGLKPVNGAVLQPFEAKSRRSRGPLAAANVLGEIVGTSHPDRFIIVTAHYDHLGIRGGQIYNGADDNASGTCALFAMAKYFAKHRPQNSLIFVAFDGEEMGLLGSQYFVAHLPVKKAAVLINLNMDMISHNDKSELYATGTYQNPSLKPFIQTVQKKAPIKLLIGHDDPKTGHDDWTSQSDQGSFYDAKIPFIYFGVEDHKDYHQPSDDFPTINQKFYVGAVETVISTIVLMDKRLTPTNR